MKIAVLHSMITEGNNGAEKLSYLLARSLGSRLYTCGFDPKVESSYPGISKMVEVDPIEHPGSFSRQYSEIMKSMTDRTDIGEDFIIYSGHLPCFRVRKDTTPYLYFCHTPERGFFDLREELIRTMKGWGLPKYLSARILYERRRRMDLDLFRNKIDPGRTVTNSELIRRRYRDAYGRTPRCALGAPIETRRYSFREPEGYLFTAGGLRWNKRVDWQIRAVAGAGRKLKIAGDGPLKDELQRLTRELGADVEFLGRVDDDEMTDLYSRCDAFLFSAKDEDFGMVPLEAMASGKPVISVNEGGPLEYLNDRNSFLFNDIEGLVEVLKRTGPEDYVPMRDECVKTARYFDIDAFTRRVLDVINSIQDHRNG